MANADNEDAVMDIEEIEDGEIKDSQEVYVILSETDGEDEPEGVDSYGRVKRPRPNDKDSVSSLSAITKNVTLGSLLAIDRSRPNTNNSTSAAGGRTTVATRKVTRGNLADHGRHWELGDRTRTIRPYNKVWGSQIFNNRDRNKPALTQGVQSRRKRNDIWGSAIEGSRQEAIQRKRKAERSKPKRRSKSKEYDTLLREYREVQRAIRAEEARQNADSNRRASSVRRSLPRRHSRLSSVAKTTPKQRPKSRSSVTSVENSKDVDSKSKQDVNSKPKEDANSKPKQDEEDDEMTELELRRLALVSASKKVSVKGANDPPIDSLNSGSRVTRQHSSKEMETATPANNQPTEQDNYEEVAMEVEDDTSGAQNTEKRSSPVTERPKSASQKNSTSAKEEEDDDEIEELALRAELLKTMASKKNAVLANQDGATSDTGTTKVVNSPKPQESVATESPKTQSRRSSPYQERTYTYQPTRITRQPVIPPTHGPLVITVNGDSDSSDEEPTADDQVKQFLRQFRNPPQQSRETPTVEDHAKVKDKVMTKTPEALNKLPETHVAEYRRLKEEIARREQRKDTKKGNASEQNEIKLKRIAALEAKLSRNRSTMEKNYRMYQESARQQSEKQRNMQKALFRIQKLREQIAVMEKVVVLNRNLMKKYSDEQKSRLLTLEGCVPVENEVREELMVLRDTKVEEFELIATVKQLRDERTEMTKNQMQTGLQEKSTKMSKAVRKRANELHSLKKLEEELALKIKQYREAQAIAANQPTATSEDIREKKVEGNIRPAVSIYKKDKIPFSSSNTPTQTDSETEKENIDKDDSGDNARRKRRRSWLDDNSSLTPQLSAKQKKVTHVTKFKDRLNSNRKERNLVEPQLVERNLVESPQSVAVERSDGINNCDRGIHQSPRGDYLHPSNYFMKELLSGRRRKRSILKVHSEAADEGAQVIKFGKYISPLMCFKAYRLHEAYWKTAGLSPFSKTVSNKVDPRRVLCKFELNGVCNDSSCRCLHERDYLLSDEAILADLLSYSPSLVNVTPKMTPKEQSQKIQRFLQSVKEQVGKENTNHPTKDEASFYLKSVVRQLKKENVECPVLCERQWIPKSKDSVNQTKSKQEDAEEEEDNYFQVVRASIDPEGIKIVGVGDSRYYSSEDKDIEALESLVLEEPNEICHWLNLVNLIKGNSSTQSQDRALNALSRGLEHNPSSSELWLLYLSLYSSRPEHPDLAEICSQAMDHCKEYSVHWKCLEVAETYHTKLSTCQDILQFLMSDPSKRKEERSSHEIFETLLYQTQLHILTGQVKEACQLLKDVLSCTTNDDNEDGAILRFLTRSDTCLLWVIYIHLESFLSLPQCLFEDNGCGLGHVIKKSHFICPWHQPLARSLDEVIALFDAASKSVKEDGFYVCSVLYHNWIALLSSSNRKQEAVDLCRHILEKHPEERSVWKTLLALEMKRSEDIIKVREVYYEAFSKCPPSPQLYYTAAKIENSEGFPAEAVTILSDSAAAFFELPPEGVSHEYTCNLFRILLRQPVPISFKSPPMQTKFQPIVDDSQAYIWLCFCFLLTLKPFSSDEEGLNPKNAFELAISSLPSGEGLLDVCLQYFQYQLWRSGPTVDEKGRTLRQVIKSIVATRPSSFPFPFTEDRVYVDYSFHNSVLEIYLEHLQPECLTEAYEDYISLMPQNLGLLQKFIDYLWKGEAYHYIKFLAKSALAIHPKSLFLWNVLLQATEKTGDVKEVAYLSSEAARALPIVPHLWRQSYQKVNLNLPGTSEKTSDELAAT